MKLPDEEKALKALEILGFKFPDRKNYKSVLEQVDYEHLLAMRDSFKSETDYFLEIMEYLLGEVTESTCYVCGVMKYAYSDIPEFWVRVNMNGRVVAMCDECKIRYVEKFNRLPDIVKSMEELADGL